MKLDEHVKKLKFSHPEEWQQHKSEKTRLRELHALLLFIYLFIYLFI